MKLVSASVAIPHSRPLLGQEERIAVEDAIESGWVGGGGEISDSFSGDLASRLARPASLPVSSGTAALEIALRVLRVEGHQVAMPAYSCPSIYRAITRAGASPLLVDVDSDDLSIPPDQIESVARSCAVVIIVHQFGIPAACARNVSNVNVPIVEDVTTALGAKSAGNQIGKVGRLVVLSMGATKLVCAGEGGAIAGELTDVEVARAWTDPESRLGYDEPVPNAKLSAMACAMGQAQLHKLNGFLERRARIAAYYDDTLGQRAYLVVRPRSDDTSTWWRYLVRVSPLDPGDVIERARARGIGFARPVLERRWAATGRYTVSDRLHASLVSIPIYPSLTDAEVELIAETSVDLLRR